MSAVGNGRDEDVSLEGKVAVVTGAARDSGAPRRSVSPVRARG